MNEPVSPGEGQVQVSGMESIQLWRSGDRLWRYRYLSPDGTVVRSNRSFLAREEAVESASLAYPGVPMVELSRPPYAAPKEPLRRMAKLGMVTGGGGLLALGLAKLIRSLRRGARRAKKARRWMRIASDIARRRNP
jgi:hypothetical protein